ncbi:sarcoplasmic reticulum histidine-rich calcium-binding protein-like [Quillaja saponaria]|uniref:Sarcoplasmic reticulum histidine-rich calcium-binding protein-like n=1 Tax=Quillaja saponaria TaxID=32244 RepID=A0AAD7L5T5_QUISA|nr:sarcoplasmic reticulum histidine-rich calcium-binding protein-like [Quillaja saponaria]
MRAYAGKVNQCRIRKGPLWPNPESWYINPEQRKLVVIIPITWTATLNASCPPFNPPSPSQSNSPKIPALPTRNTFCRRRLFLQPTHQLPTQIAMAKLIATCAVFLFVFPLSYARSPVDNGDPLFESNKNPVSANTILLPSDSEAATVIEREPQSTADSKISQLDAGLEFSTESSEASKSVPLTVISFRPINHHIPRRPLPLWLRRGRRCHNHNHNFKPWGPRFPHLEIKYSNDMIMKDGKDRSFDKFDPMFRGVECEIPARWGKFRHGGPRFSFGPGMEKREETRKRHNLDHHHNEEGQNFEREDHHHGGVFLKTVPQVFDSVLILIMQVLYTMFFLFFPCIILVSVSGSSTIHVNNIAYKYVCMYRC